MYFRVTEIQNQSTLYHIVVNDQFSLKKYKTQRVTNYAINPSKLWLI